MRPPAGTDAGERRFKHQFNYPWRGIASIVGADPPAWGVDPVPFGAPRPGAGTERSVVMSVEGLVTIRSPHDPEATLARVQAEVQARGLTVFARIDHAADAAQVGMTLRPTAVLIFGNARGGTPLMQAGQTIGIELPLRMLVWQDASAATWLSYNDPLALLRRHGLDAQAAAAAPLVRLLEAVAAAAAQAPDD